MFLTWLMLVVALSLSAIAAFYSIIGLTAIFAAAVIPVAIMGTILEIAKLTVTVWLHEYWHRCRTLMKVYLVPAVGMLMLITSMGIFGFLSKAHMDQSLVSGDVQSKIAIYDEKIKIERENIDANRKALKQLDEAVDQVMGRSTDEKGADKAVAIRRGQQKERSRLLAEIAQSQTRIAALNEERAPIAAEVRKVEAEVGPIKYIAALVYGDNPDANLLERAVRWVIIILVIVFDPLAIFMLLASTESYKWEKYGKAGDPEERNDPNPELEPKKPSRWDVFVDRYRSWPVGWKVNKDDTSTDVNATVTTNNDGPDNGHDANVEPSTVGVVSDTTESASDNNQRGVTVYVDMPDIVTPASQDDEDDDNDTDAIKEAKRRWKAANPDGTIKGQRRLYEMGLIPQPPWEEFIKEDTTNVDFGADFPTNPTKGDTFIRVDYLPTKLYKYNGDKWIEVDKNNSDTFVYNDQYIDHLIAKIGSGEYDPELLNANEREQIEERLRRDHGLNG